MKNLNIIKSPLACLLPLLLAFSASATQAQVTLRGHVPEAVHSLLPIGSLPKQNQMNLAIGLPVRNQAELNAFLQELSDPASPNFRQYLTPAQFTERFGPTEKDYQAVINFAQSHGLS